MASAAEEPQRAREILRYFVRNPHAADTLEGVARWRLLQEAIHHGVEETRQALEWLVSEGYLNESSTAYSTRIYCLNADKLRKAERFLGRRTGSSGDPEQR